VHIRDERDIKEFENLVDEAEGFTAEYIETVISEDLQRLNPLQNGLGNDATEYVLHGERSWCLKAIEAIAPVQTLEVLLLHSSVQQKTHQRRMLLLNCASAQLDLVKRYAEVLAAIAGGDLENAPGGDAVPVIARVFFGELFLVIADGKRVGANRNLMKADDVPGLDTARQFLVHLGCSEVDTIDLLYTKSKRRGEANAAVWRRLIDVKPILADAPEDLVVSATRMLPAARKVLVLDFVRMGLGTTPSALSFLLEQCAVSTKGINLLAMKALRHVPSETLEPLAAEKLVNGNIGVRTAMVEVLITIGTPSARAVLRAHAGNEKSARIVSAIKKVIGADEILEQDRTLDKQNGYLALDKTFIDIPTLVVQKDVPLPSFGDSDVAELREHIRLENAWRKKHNETRAKQAHGETLSLLDPSTADELVAVFSEPMAAEPMSFLTHDLSSACASWIQEALAKMPDTAAMHLCTCFDRAIISRSLTTYGYSTPVQTRVSEFLWSPDGDLRLLDSRQNLACSAAEKVDVNSSSHPVKQTELKLTGWLSTNSSQLLFDKLAELPRKVVWPYLATHLHVFDEALGLRPSLTHKFDLQMTLAMLSLLPAVPERLFDSLMVIATGSSPTCRKQARELLAELPELEARLIDLLDDRRQQMRASVADWLGESGSVASVTALKARIVKEKQPIVRVAVLEALDKLACDSADLFRPVALLEEAEKGLKQTKLEKLTWLFLQSSSKSRVEIGCLISTSIV